MEANVIRDGMAAVLRAGLSTKNNRCRLCVWIV